MGLRLSLGSRETRYSATSCNRKAINLQSQTKSSWRNAGTRSAELPPVSPFFFPRLCTREEMRRSAATTAEAATTQQQQQQQPQPQPNVDGECRGLPLFDAANTEKKVKTEGRQNTRTSTIEYRGPSCTHKRCLGCYPSFSTSARGAPICPSIADTYSSVNHCAAF